MSSTIEELAALKQLLDQGVLTPEEFYAKKAQILAAPTQNGTTAVEEGSTAGWAILSFFFPIIGLILFIVWKDSKPKSSRAAGKGALIGVIVCVLASLLISCMAGAAALTYY